LKNLEVRVPHSLGKDEVRRRLEHAVVRARDEYADNVGAIEASWQGDDLLAVGVNVMGMQIDGEVEILVEELLVRLEVPMMAALFAGRIREGIEERLGGLLGAERV
jgi:putative polyhydroxyalkanoate system protein